MKKINLLLIAFAFSIAGFSQSIQSEIEVIQSIYGLDKKEITKNFLELDANQEAEFWKLYDEYEIKRKNLGEKKFDVLTKYVTEYGEILPENADEMMKVSISLRKDTDKLIDSYYKKIKKKTDPIVALQFYQLERYLSDIVRMTLLEELFVTKN